MLGHFQEHNTNPYQIILQINHHLEIDLKNLKKIGLSSCFSSFHGSAVERGHARAHARTAHARAFFPECAIYHSQLS